MKSFRKELHFNTPTRRAFINITGKVDEALRESGIKEVFAWLTPCTYRQVFL